MHLKLTTICQPYKVPEVIRLLNGRAYWLREDIPYVNEHGRPDRVPKGFVFDGFSVPFLRKFLSDGGWNIAGAALHDWQYTIGTPRWVADASLGLNMRRAGEDENAAIIVAGVLFFTGFVAYNHYKTLRRGTAYFAESRLAETQARAEFLAKTVYL